MTDVRVVEFIERDASFRLVADVDDDRAVIEDAKDLALHDLLGGDVTDRQADGFIELLLRLEAHCFARELLELLRVDREFLD